MSCEYQSQQSNSPWFGQSANHGICRRSHLAAVGGYICGSQWHPCDNTLSVMTVCGAGWCIWHKESHRGLTFCSVQSVDVFIVIKSGRLHQQTTRTSTQLLVVHPATMSLLQSHYLIRSSSELQQRREVIPWQRVVEVMTHERVVVVSPATHVNLVVSAVQ